MDPDASDEMVDHLVDFFDRVAPVYDTWAGGQHGRVATRLVDLATPSQNEQVLDVGTGTGLVANLVAPRVSPGLVIGVDLSENMLSIARANKAKNVQFVGMAAEHLVFRPATFDLVTMGQALPTSPTRRPRSPKRTGCCVPAAGSLSLASGGASTPAPRTFFFRASCRSPAVTTSAFPATARSAHGSVSLMSYPRSSPRRGST